ncbi:MAG: TetR family transcriptional regulator [Bacteroidetes bacterium MedPE-SWsnd-G2]|nr:MAG: TetR family transcriptional regulator [Bacteroidetes bacterium MedPE-SWsnd-G2]
MKHKILVSASDLFLSYGFKSVTMDDIANKIGISKKTIYQHFSNKTELIEATTLHLFDEISKGIDEIILTRMNPIEEIFEIKKFVLDHLKDEKSSPQYQLQKYYPQIYDNLKCNQFDVMNGCVSENLKRGIEMGLYRDSINIDFITRIYFNCMLAIKDRDLFPLKKFSINTLMEHYIIYHLRGICTDKGIAQIHQFTNTTH